MEAPQEVEAVVKILRKAQHPEHPAKFPMIRLVHMMNGIMVRYDICTYLNEITRAINTFKCIKELQ